MTNILRIVLSTSFHGSIVILAVLALRLVLKKAPKKYICLLWMLAGLRLLLPITLQSDLSLQPRSIPVTIDFSQYLPYVWLGMAAVILLINVIAYTRLRLQVLDAVKVPGGWESDRIETAFVLGFIKPKIYIPAGMSDEARKQILAHERTHLDKGDHWIKIIGFLALAVHWFNPLVWLSYVLLCRDMEMACDERVVQFMELPERKEYSTALLQCSTNRVHYAACPVAFGEVNVKYRIQSVLNYRKPAFYMGLLGVLAIAFVALCLLTSPESPEEAYQRQLQKTSLATPESFTPAVSPAVPENPDWGLTLTMDVANITGGRLHYAWDESFADACQKLQLESSVLLRYNGTDWESLTGSDATSLTERRSLGIDRNHPEMNIELEWPIVYGPLPAGDYCLKQTLSCALGRADWYVPFHIYRQPLPTEQETALNRCANAMQDLYNSSTYALKFYALDPTGNRTQTMELACCSSDYKLTIHLGQYTIATLGTESAQYIAQKWPEPFRLDLNRQFLFPEGQSVISNEEIRFLCVGTDAQGHVVRNTDTVRFESSGVLQSYERLTETLDAGGAVLSRKLDAVERIEWGESILFGAGSETYTARDSFEQQSESPWGILFRVDDDYLSPTSGEIWLAHDGIGVSNITTDDVYWLERRVGNGWTRLGGESTVAHGGAAVQNIIGQTLVYTVDWSDVYGTLEPGVYRMSKRISNGQESSIHHAEFKISAVGGIYGEGGQAAFDRVKQALDALDRRGYCIELFDSNTAKLANGASKRFWRYGETTVEEFMSLASQSAPEMFTYVGHPGDPLYWTFGKDLLLTGPYVSTYFPEGYSTIRDDEIQFVMTYSNESDAYILYTFRFDETGAIREIVRQFHQMQDGVSLTGTYVVLDKTAQEIAQFVAEAEKNQ